MLLGDTIAAVASAPGRGSRAIVRVSGPRTLETLRRLLDAVPEFRGASVARMSLGAGRSVPVPLLVFRAPRSYTGQDAAELQIPGNATLVSRVMDRLTAQPGVRVATAGEFTARAYFAGRLTLEQAEGVARLIAAQTQDERRAAEGLLRGETGERWRGWAEELAELLALVEAGIDFTDQEDVVAIAPAELASRLGALRERWAGEDGGSAGPDQDETARVVLVGEPSAGKSTLFNALLGRRRAVTHESPGTTRDAIEEPLDLSGAIPGGGVVTLVDAPGIEDDDAPAGGGACGGVRAASQRRLREELERADVVVRCDPAGRFERGLPSGPESGAVVLRVRTKSDLGPGPARDGAVEVCALDGRGLDGLRASIVDAVSRGPGGSSSSARHRRALHAARGALDDALRCFDPGARTLDEPELVAGSLRESLDRLGEVVGGHDPDAVIGRVFASFCVGK